jgi:two-component system sensor histidine kinase DctS
MLKPALEQASAQAQRAGQIIRSVHEFVRKREPARQADRVGQLLDGILPLIELQARQFFVAIQIAAARPAAGAGRPHDARAGAAEPDPQRHRGDADGAAGGACCASRPRTTGAGHGRVSVIDQGHGIPDEVAERLFSPFFSTKAEGMGMGLNICRTAIEFHGGTLTHRDNPQGGTIFRFTCPARAADAALPAQ